MDIADAFADLIPLSKYDPTEHTRGIGTRGGLTPHMCPSWSGFEVKSRFQKCQRYFYEIQKELSYVFPKTSDEREILDNISVPVNDILAYLKDVLQQNKR